MTREQMLEALLNWCDLLYVKASRSGCNCQPGRCIAPEIMGLANEAAPTAKESRAK